MGDLLTEGLEWLAEELLAHASRPITYCRGDEEISIYAVVGQAPLRLDDDYGGVVLEWTNCDILIAAKDLSFGGKNVFPQRGDKIITTYGNTKITYEVFAPGNEPEWRWSGSPEIMFRIHTKEINREEV